MSWLFSQALVEEYSAATCLAGQPCAQLNVMPTPHKFWRNDKTIEPSDHSRFGLTSQLLTADHGAELLTSFLAASLARTSARPARAQVSQAHAAGYGPISNGLLAKLTPDLSMWRTAQFSLLEDSELFCETWPNWGSMRNGASYLRKTPALPIVVHASGLWPTVTVCGNNNQPGASKNAGWGLSSAVKQWATPSASDSRRGGTITENMTGSSLAQQVNTPALWPTPTASLGEKGGRITPRKGREGGTLIEAVSARTMWATPLARDWRSGKTSKTTENKNSRPLSEQVVSRLYPTPTAGTTHSGGTMQEWGGSKNWVRQEDPELASGQLNPQWVEWLMGWPIGWTELKPLEMAKFREWQQQHGGF